MSTPEALAALYGEGEREQVIGTPQNIIDAVCTFWPCGWVDRAPGPIEFPASKAAAVLEEDGLRGMWDGPLPSFCNPPFNDLQPWLLQGVNADFVGHQAAILLVPARMHREWMCEAEYASSATAWLKPVSFFGYKGSFPFPCFLLYYGPEPNRFAQAFKHLAHRIDVKGRAL